MSKKIASRKPKRDQPERKSRRRVVLVAIIVLSVSLAGIVLARWKAARVANSTSTMLAAPASPPAPAFSPNSPSKEYIYAGGRLLATEEPITAGSYSLSLGGAGDYVQAPSSTSLNITGAITLEAWIKYNSTGAYQSIVARESANVAGGGGGYELILTDTGKVRLNIWVSPTSYAATIGATTVTTGVWHHVAGVSDGTQRRIYLDGVLDASVTGALVPASGTAGLKIGRRSSSTSSPFTGLIDEVRVSGAALYTANFTPQDSLTSSSSTKGLWKFNDQTANDSSGNGNNGTLAGGASFSTDVP